MSIIMKPVKTRLESILDEIDITDSEIDAFRELAYTANDTGLTDIRFSDEYTIDLIFKLVKLAKKYKNNVPLNLRV